ncbi:CPBP family glutamic-type intramembrane protease [Spirosoma linguale]|uniref:Abortive infection protein n=1 Tax=Spirosoma linguale (strain ATCC 33905 / DSM 74 / LMG 10896 / Claus 1) TaxID=504472 RepID=D2QPU0_SPILD|nr:hypothetical protein Slin_1626 [Spirosoma linguale DSM 74]
MKIFTNEIFFLLKNGKLNNKHNVNTIQSLKDSVVIFLFSYIINITIGSTILILSRHFNIVIPKNETLTALFEKNIFSIIFTIIILAPMFEEILFRVSLKYSLKNLTLMLTFIFYLVSGAIAFPFENVFNIVIRSIISILFGLLFYILINRSIKLKSMIEIFWLRHTKFIFYMSILLFGLSHLLNYPINIKLLLYIPLLTLSQIFSGIILGYVRLKYGIIYSFFIHASKNTISVLTAIALTHQ